MATNSAPDMKGGVINPNVPKGDMGGTQPKTPAPLAGGGSKSSIPGFTGTGVMPGKV